MTSWSIFWEFFFFFVGESMMRNDFTRDTDWHEQGFQKIRFFISEVSYPLTISSLLS